MVVCKGIRKILGQFLFCILWSTGDIIGRNRVKDEGK